MNVDRPRREELAASPRVSVVMVFHDARRYLEEAVASVRAQTFPDWELVLVDDGSGDGSRDIAESLAMSDTGRIRLVQHAGRRNLGTGASRSLGVSCAWGEYLAFLDADDVYLPDRLARHVELLDRHPEVALVQSRVEFWNSWPTNEVGVQEDRPESVLPLPSGEPIEPPHLLVLLLRSRGYTVPAVCSLTIRSHVVRRVGGFEASFRTVYEDQVLLAKLYLQCRTLVIDDVLARYRQHADSIVHRLEREEIYVPGWPNPAERAFLDWLQQYIDATSCDSLPLRDAVRVARWPYVHPWAWRLAHLPTLSLRAARRAAQRVLPSVLLDPILDLRRRQKERAAARRARAEGRRLERALNARQSREGGV
jgi:glycosyltransferase involved in cell wall biosynthesis